MAQNQQQSFEANLPSAHPSAGDSLGYNNDTHSQCDANYRGNHQNWFIDVMLSKLRATWLKQDRFETCFKDLARMG